jgi:hypothetical protein
VDVTPVVFLELVASVVGVVDGWDELDDTPNPSHNMVTVFVFTAGAPLNGRSDDGPRWMRTWMEQEGAISRFRECGSGQYIWGAFGWLIQPG